LCLRGSRCCRAGSSAAVDVRARAATAPIVDGDLSDPAWQNAQEITGFIQRDPNEGQPAVEQTKVKVVYDDDAIYFGARMEDSAKVTPLLARRDSDLNTVTTSVSASAFVVNASNVRMDMILYNDINDDIAWDAVWSSATKIGLDGCRRRCEVRLCVVAARAVGRCVSREVFVLAADLIGGASPPALGRRR
jgi:hypothetical protein